MKTLHIKNIERYHPKYKDRHLIWCKVYFSMIESDDEFEMLDEIDKWRFIVFVIMELKKKEPIILDEKYLSRKGFDFKKKSLSKTLDALSPFIEVCNKMLQNVTTNENPVTHNRIDYNRIDYNIIDKNRYLEFVLLTDDEHKKLIEKFGKSGTSDKIQSLNNGIGSKGYKYKSHYHAILSWERKNGQSSKSKPNRFDLKNIDYSKGTEGFTKR